MSYQHESSLTVKHTVGWVCPAPSRDLIIHKESAAKIRLLDGTKREPRLTLQTERGGSVQFGSSACSHLVEQTEQL